MITLVTGATGLVGNNVVRLLLQRGHRVRVLGRTSSDSRPLADLDVERATGDIRDADSLRAACRGVGRVIHAAARVHIGWSGLAEQRAVNVEGTRNVALAAREAGARLVHVSTVDTMGRGTRQCPADEETPLGRHVECPYVVTKREAEKLVLDLVPQGLDAVIVNPAYMLGPWDWKPSSGRMLLAVARGQGLAAPPGGNDFCDVRDVAAGILAAAETGIAGRRYILGGHPLSYYEAWSLFAEITGRRRPMRVMRVPVVHALGALGSLWGRITGREPDLNRAAAALSVMEHHFSAERAVRELGYQMRSVREATVAAWEWFVGHGYTRL
ncbi:MAG TPA: NAD-dependent epimerase/dehydratase family protein [Pirellulales bacterium]|nr:NAD-dependent epimerase/dehydratase family protein [Pirellulales bacterium]